jgi:SynChlorMet cassette protein ScmC
MLGVIAGLAHMQTVVAKLVEARFIKIIKKRRENTIGQLATADGCEWRFCVKGKSSSRFISRFKHVMGMNRQVPAALAAPKTGQIKKIVVSVSQKEIRWRNIPVEHANEISCRVGPVSTPEKMAFQLTRISKVVANSSEKNGGLLVHGALAEWNGTGVILAGPGGVGKTTASKRLPPPWRSLSDDNSLIVKSPDGYYWAHPWPTWSRYRLGDMSGSWDVQAAVKLGVICILSQGKRDHAFRLPISQAISELVEVSGQTFFIMANGMDKDAIRSINLLRFHNAVAISNKIPVCRLEISLDGKFWNEIAGFLGSSAKLRETKK